MTFRGILTPLLSLFALSGAAHSATRDIHIDPSEDRGTWEAWGCSLAWWGKVFGDREDLADLFFTTQNVPILGAEQPGLGMTFVRYNAGACSWKEVEGRKMGVSKIILPYRQMEGFWLDGADPDPDSASWDWSVDANQRQMMQMAKARGATHFELFSNSPMWWMCRNDNPSGAADARADNLREDQYSNFAHYLATIARKAKDEWGVPFTTVSPFNEPISAWWFADCKQEGCHVSREAQEKILPLVRKALDSEDLHDLPLAASDENTYDEAIDTWRSFRPAVRKLVEQINVHGYQYGQGSRDRLQRIAEKDGKKLWNSEYGDGNGDGIEMAKNLLLDFEYLRPTAWAYWQPLDGGGWGLIDADMPRAELKAVNPKHHVLAQFSRHILPGMNIIGTSSREAVAAYSRDLRRLVLVTLNEGDEKEISLDLSSFRTGQAAAARWITEPRGAARYEFRRDLQVEQGAMKCTLPADSIVTVEIRNLDL
ncbi:galactan endo-1,6-beta-galactosidase [Haloferula luteola]|uniref:Galactan endo-1,6-beta-galactosidase n=1 Tax=Haloferula luteola TaxID=595692 RepID=A0A840V0P7_9BACT|nr:glycoside hydrolase [Haloferula luteola]MBB5351572.1 galactan endo-1,6-beta-galactosidase [Haloferula luteola]